MAVPFRVYYFVNEQGVTGNGRNCLQFGVGVSARHFKKAVDRNRIKRLTREAWRLQHNELKEKLKEQNKGLDVFFIYTGKELTDYKTVSDKVQQAIKKLLKLADENIASNS